MLTLILRSIIVYTIVLFAVRLMGKRQIGDMQPFELVITLIIADLACIPMSDVAIPLVFGLVPLLTLVLLHHVFTLLNRKSIFFRKVLNGKPIIVIDENGIDYDALKKMNMTINDLTEALRACNCFNINDAGFAIVETNGNVSVLPKYLSSPPTASDLKLPDKTQTLPVIVINDGKIVKENLDHLDITEDKLEKILRSQKVKKVGDVLVLTLDKAGSAYLQEKYKKGVEFTVK